MSMEYLSLGRTRGRAGFLFEKRPSNAICNRGCFFYSPIHVDNTTFYLQLLILSICIYNNLDRAKRPPNNTRLTNQEAGSFWWKYKMLQKEGRNGLKCFYSVFENNYKT